MAVRFTANDAIASPCHRRVTIVRSSGHPKQFVFGRSSKESLADATNSTNATALLMITTFSLDRSNDIVRFKLFSLLDLVSHGLRVAVAALRQCAVWNMEPVRMPA